MGENFKKYLLSFLVGLGGGLFLIFSPALYEVFPFLGKIPNIASDLEGKIKGFFNIPANQYRSLLQLASYYVLSLPIFLLALTVQFKLSKAILKSRQRSSFFFSFLFFSAGAIFAYLIFFVLALIAISQWSGPSL